jgi:hypothetical protein
VTLTVWRPAYLDSAVGANTITDLVWRRVQTYAARESGAAARLRWIANYHNRKAC